MIQFDPLLTGRNYDFPQVDTQADELQKRMMEMQQQFRQQVRPQTPIWDEIDGIVDNMSEAEKEYLASDEAYGESAAAVQAILQREILRSMRPVVEATKDGKTALETHLSLLKRVQKSAKEEAAKRESLMNEYIMHHSDKTWQEFLEMKQGKQMSKARKK